MKNIRAFLRSILPILMAMFLLTSNFGTVPAANADPKPDFPPQEENLPIVTDTWAVQLEPGADPDKLALALGAKNLGPITSLENYYLFQIPGSEEVSGAADLFAAEQDITWFEQQVAYQHDKRLIGDPFNDPYFGDQWHLNNTGQTGGTPGEDINVIPVWNQNYTGSGVRVAVVDDGLQWDHPDLAGNYQAASSYDYYGVCSTNPCTTPGTNPDANPYPFIDQSKVDSHGTPAAGIVAAVDNTTCGVGVAYQAKLSGIRLIAGPTTDAMEANALTHYYNDSNYMNHIFSNSWGPPDTGRELQGPGSLTQSALISGITNGRDGLGSIYVWSAGNGLVEQDNVNFDGYANSRYTIAVGAIDHNGKQAYYSEPGAAMLVTAYSAGAVGTGAITTTDLLGDPGLSAGDCTFGYGGTSASAPIVSGIIALMLDANPNLSWRDVQHILAETAVKNDPTDAGWTNNAAGYHINHKYGFGRVDAEAAVNMALTWNNVGSVETVTSPVKSVNTTIADNNTTGVTSTINITEQIVLEHVEVIFNATHPYRGDLKVVLTSPSGTQSILADKRSGDYNDNFSNWKFMTVRNWGEASTGNWTLKVTDTDGGDIGTFNNWQLILHGRNEAIANVDVEIEGQNRGTYYMVTGQEVRLTYGLDTGPVVVTNTSNNSNIIANLRDITRDAQGTLVSVTSMMGLPQALISDSYVFPVYTNNGSVVGQLLVGNISGQPTTVTVSIGGAIENRTYNLGIDEEVRLTYQLNAGPVVVKSNNGNIIAALRDITRDSTGKLVSVTSMMGLPQSLLSSTYVFPVYTNNGSVVGQLLIGNISGQPTTVTVSIGGVIGNRTYNLGIDEEVRLIYQLNAGPVVVKSNNGNIIATLRDITRDSTGKLVSVTSMMGLPQSLLSSTYVFPVYTNNGSVVGQLLVGVP